MEPIETEPISGDDGGADTAAHPTARRPKRRWAQFSLRTFLVVLTLGCLWLGWHMHLTREQKRSVDALQKLGGSIMVCYDYHLNDLGGVDINAPLPGPKWLRDTFGLDFFCTVRKVYIHGRPMTDTSFLNGLRGLTYLQITHSPLSDTAPLAELGSLEHLDLSDTQVSDLRPLARLTNLVKLDLSRTPVRDIAPLAKLKRLEVVDLFGTDVSDPSPLAELANLKELYLDDAPVSEKQVEALRRKLPGCDISWGKE